MMTRKGKGLRFGTLNVGSLNKTGRKEEIIKMMIRRKIDILGLSETKWPGQGMKQMRRGHHIIWSGEKEEKRNVVAIILSPEMIDKVTQVDYVSGRIIKINLLSKGKEIEILQVYAPQVGCTDV
jgi:exonuclease III